MPDDDEESVSRDESVLRATVAWCPRGVDHVSARRVAGAAPPDLIASPEEEVVTIGASDLVAVYRPDVQVREPWTLKEPSATDVATAQRTSIPPAICILRAARPGEHEVYPIRLRERLPVIRIPLRPADADVILDLQPLIDQCHERGRYHLLKYQLELDPPLTPEDASWVTGLLHDHGLT